MDLQLHDDVRLVDVGSLVKIKAVLDYSEFITYGSCCFGEQQTFLFYRLFPLLFLQMQICIIWVGCQITLQSKHTMVSCTCLMSRAGCSQSEDQQFDPQLLYSACQSVLEQDTEPSGCSVGV